MSCKHEQFEAAVVFNRFTDEPGVHMEVRARCALCQHALVWTVPDVGINPDRPTVSLDGQELRVPCWVSPAEPTP